jgi:hypothetical protein
VKRRGQVTFIAGIILFTMLNFLFFVVNTGVLVSAKINLQNAADLAAYAGAATQARQMNQIAFLNYEMRRSIKKFLYRTYVLGSQYQKKFPQSAAEPEGQYNFSPSGDPTKAFGAPSVCLAPPSKIQQANSAVTIRNAENYCAQSDIKSVDFQKLNPSDMGNSAIFDNFIKEAQQRTDLIKKTCKEYADMNREMTQFWLFNAGVINKTDFQSLLKESQYLGLAEGTGLIPGLFLLERRISTLEGFLNATKVSPDGIITQDWIGTSARSNQPEHERAQQAFMSALFTLGEKTFKTESIKLRELLPDSLLKLERVKTDFTTYYTDSDTTSSAPATESTNGIQLSTLCDWVARPVWSRDIPVAVYKPTNSPDVFYAVQLDADAELAFMPRGLGKISLRAYAAAKPFGSRIGPVYSSPQQGALAFSFPGVNVTKTPKPTCGGQPCPPPLNLPLYEGDSIGWANKKWLGTLVQATDPTGAARSNSNNPLTEKDIYKGFAIATLPNAFESGKFNILTDLEATEADPLSATTGDPMVRFFGPSPGVPLFPPKASDLTRFHAMIAPIVDSKNYGDPLQEVNSRVAQAFTAPEMQSVKDFILKRLSEYVTDLRRNDGVNREGVKIARLEDPFAIARDPAAKGLYSNLIDPKFFATNPFSPAPLRIRTSWSTTKDPNIGVRGRTGYSVKVISIKSLMDTNQSIPGIDASLRNSLMH